MRVVKKSYIIIIIAGIGVLALLFSMVLSFTQNTDDQFLLEQATGQLVDPSEDTRGSQLQGDMDDSEKDRNSILTEISILLPDIDTIYYGGQNTLYLASTRTGSIYSTRLIEDSREALLTQDLLQNKIVQLPITDVDDIFLTSNQSMERFVIYQKEDALYRYDVSQDRVTSLSEDIRYATIDPNNNMLYYLTDTNPTQIKSLSIQTNQTRTHITRRGVEWFALSLGNIIYRTSDTLYRYSLVEKVDRRIEQAIESIESSVSFQVPRTLIEIDGEIALYNTQNDTLTSLKVEEWDLRRTVWQRNGLQAHTILNSEYIVADFRGEPTVQQFSVERESMDTIDPNQIAVTENGTMLFLDADTFSLRIYPFFERNDTVKNNINETM